ncbi:DUF2092 domain-containing protein [Thiocystis violacea]|uniref:DUF2092 domain-containing protein n=1 Tax=Thiocystis violacea TaxID=13725 RepID=UPI001906C61E|nr:DUF2092 domain-containing protein [Thiocystis violacea]MBK1718583.1 hypothetical protein [Thiocystis violacea]
MKQLPLLSAMIVSALALNGCANLSGLAAGGTSESVPISDPPAVAPQPIDVLKRMATYLRSLDRFEVRVEKLTQLILPTEQRLHEDQTIEIAVDRPNQLRVEYKGLGGGRQIFYDGKEFTLNTPVAGFYAVGSAPASIDQTLEILYNEYQIELPVADLLATNTESRLVKNLSSRTYVGRILVQGVPCHHLAFRTPEVDWEIWIEDGPKPLPRRLLLTDKSVQGSPTMMANLTDWDVAPRFARGFFEFKPPKGSERVPFLTEASAAMSAATIQ